MGIYSDIEKALRLGDVRWRTFRCNDDHHSVWTTERLYDGGDYLAALLDADMAVIHIEYTEQRQQAKAFALRWWSIYNSSYVIQEEP